MKRVKTQTNSTKRTAIVKAIDALASLGADTVTTGSSLSATWRLLWTTEKEQLFIIEKAYLFGTQAGDVLQVEVDKLQLFHAWKCFWSSSWRMITFGVVELMAKNWCERFSETSMVLSKGAFKHEL
ncbi:hypothetical protein F8388_016165 [Cannabis sativa]|uniref:Plastid lipid-associated protein/fibrillin conserved domain-containing protein n=1 Tax=Cannabis sativa TaxID=3483 RepID=A0A7J6FII4_CANSA|nr:hypothetical protein F8388_016165 [Cannabis sativa]